MWQAEMALAEARGADRVRTRVRAITDDRRHRIVLNGVEIEIVQTSAVDSALDED